MNEPTDIHLPAGSAPTVTNKVAHCKVCHAQWQVWGSTSDTVKACQFCGVGETAIVIVSEAPDYTGYVVR